MFGFNKVFMIIGLTSLLFAGTAVAADDDYLKLLEAEADDLELDDKGKESKNETDPQQQISIRDKWTGEISEDDLPQNLKEKQFASLLEENFYGTFVFYRKLSAVDKGTVYLHYTKAEAPNLTDIRKDILDRLRY